MTVDLRPGVEYGPQRAMFYGSLDRNRRAVWHVKVAGKRVSPLAGLADRAEAERLVRELQS